ncbi:MAG: hypothetical protein JXC36_00500 [Candidatus Atribacteria bacterium]|nr:hypothetical protein [Candidatus Atribacteria bacterium]
MKNRIAIFCRIILVTFMVISLSACWDIGDLVEENLTIDLKSADKVNVTAALYHGDIFISGEKQIPLLISKFSYNLTRWNPEVNYTVDGGEGYLKIVQKKNTKGLFNPTINHWFLQFNEDVPLKMDIVMGSGNSQLDLNSVNLIDLKAVIGTGDTLIDLTGDYQENVNITLVGGIGNTLINLPADIGIRLMIQGGIYRIRCDGLNQIGNFYYNSIFNFTERKIFVTLIAGLGMIDVRLVPSELNEV